MDYPFLAAASLGALAEATLQTESGEPIVQGREPKGTRKACVGRRVETPTRRSYEFAPTTAVMSTNLGWFLKRISVSLSCVWK